ncbi:MAG: hypothetical protein JSW39_01235 [Desulfobacterales bacterium]|nr:MAG: hypothetical protein JSW39_01235 [Desulfobacterales bacterium]
MDCGFFQNTVRVPFNFFATRRFSSHRPNPVALSLALLAVLGLLAPGGHAETETSAGPAAGPELTAAFDQTSVPVGATVTLVLNYRLPEGARLPEQPEIRGLAGLTVLERTPAPGQIRIRLLVDRLDRLTTGTLGLVYIDQASQTQVMETAALAVEVVSNLGDKPAEAQLRPIQEIIRTQARWRTYLPWAVGLLGLLLAAGGLFWWFKRKRVEELSAEVIAPPHIRARQALEQLEAHQLFESGKIKEFYFRFSEILRRYMEDIRNFPAAECTTEEIAKQITHAQDRQLLPLLHQADLVKFADTVPSPARKEDDIQRAMAYIQATSPAAEPRAANAMGREVAV